MPRTTDNPRLKRFAMRVPEDDHLAAMAHAKSEGKSLTSLVWELLVKDMKRAARKASK